MSKVYEYFKEKEDKAEIKRLESIESTYFKSKKKSMSHAYSIFSKEEMLDQAERDFINRTNPFE